MKKARFWFLLICIIVTLGGCTTTELQPSEKQAIQSWIKQQAISLKTTDPSFSLDDLEPLRQVVGNASIVGLGEATHGSHEFFTMKHRLLRFLVEKMGFTTFAMEGSWSAGEQINRYVLTGQGEAEDVLRQFRFWTWNTQEVFDLLEWMRQYNADPRHSQKVGFAGFDSQIVQAITFHEVEDYFQLVDLPKMKQVISLYTGLRPDAERDAYLKTYRNLPATTKKQYHTQAQQVYDLLKQNKEAYELSSSPSAFTQALQRARIIVQYAQLMAQQSNTSPQADQRDSFMAENITWLHENTQMGERMVLWAHNGHISASEQSQPMGSYLKARYKDQYLPLGFSFYQGSFNAIGAKNNKLQVFSTQAPEPQSSNAILGGGDTAPYILDLRKNPPDPVNRWLDGTYSFRTIGAIYDNTQENTFYVKMSLRKTFDVLIHIQNITPSLLLSLGGLSTSIASVGEVDRYMLYL